MTERHRALVVEDDAATAEDLELVLDALGFAHEVVDNQREALQRFESEDFCLVLLDLQIKLNPESLKGHAEAGRELLRRMRSISPRHMTGRGPAVPIVVVSGHAKEADEAVEAMRDGADDVVQKPITKSRLLPDRIRRALETNGRGSHDLCVVRLVCAPERKQMVLCVPADQRKRRFTVQVGNGEAALRPASLDLLLRLILGKLKGAPVHRTDLGWAKDQGFQGMTRLRNDLLPCGVAPDEVVVSLHHGNYKLADAVEIGACDFDRLRAIGGSTARLAAEIEKLQQAGSGTTS